MDGRVAFLFSFPTSSHTHAPPLQNKKNAQTAIAEGLATAIVTPMTGWLAELFSVRGAMFLGAVGLAVVGLTATVALRRMTTAGPATPTATA